MAGPDVHFDPYSREFLLDHHDAYRRVRQETPVYYNAERDFYALTHYGDVVNAYRDHETYSSARGFDLAMVKSDQPPPPAILFMDPPDHRRMRGLVSKSFGARSIGALDRAIEELVEHYLAAADPSRFDVVGDFSALFPLEIIAGMAGVPPESRQQVRLWVDETNSVEPGQMERSAASNAALGNAVMFFYDLVQKRRAEPVDDLISRLLDAEVERENGEVSRLDDLEITGFALLIAGAGGETVTELVGNAMAVFARHPDQWDKLRADRSKVPAAVEELLRYDGPVRYNVRWTLREAVVQGIVIPAGNAVLLCGPAANRDPAVFADPDRFDIDRPQIQPAHLGFGYGIHTCLGAPLARLESVIAINHLLDFMPRYEVLWEEAKRLEAPTVTGWQTLPVRVLP
ncbi:MAG: cytochrome P450 [Mycolicibacterium cosmeticum]|nr:cytochrome P450 [Mycolicibacterium cosmeticum]